MHLRDDHDGASSPWEAAGRERPVFLDEAGRRHRLLRPFGLLAAVVAAAWLGALLVGATGFATIAPLHGPLAGRPFAHASAPAHRRAHLRTRLLAERTRLRPTGAPRTGPAAAADRS